MVVMSVLPSEVVAVLEVLEVGGFDVVRHRPEDVVKGAVALLGLASLALDLLRHQVEGLILKVHCASLSLTTSAHRTRFAQHSEVLGHGLDGSASSLSVASRVASPPTMSRLVGSARAEKTTESGSLTTKPLPVFEHSVEYNRRTERC